MISNGFPRFSFPLLFLGLLVTLGSGCSSDDDGPPATSDAAPGAGGSGEQTATDVEADAATDAEPDDDEGEPEAESSPDAEVTEVKGDVKLNGKALQPGPVRLQGQIVARKGRAVIELPGAGSLRIFPHTRTSVGETKTRITVRLVLGKIWSAVGGLRGERRFEVRTRNAVAGVRGTEYVVEADENETDVRVMEGEVEVENEAGDAQVVKSRQRSKVKGRKRPSKPQPYNPGIDRKVWNTAMTVKRDVTKGVRTIEKDVSKTINRFVP